MRIRSTILFFLVGVAAITATVYFSGSDSASLTKHDISSVKPDNAKYAEQRRSDKSGFHKIAISSDNDTSRLIGPDSNGNYVRDDIDQYIEKTYTDPRQRSAMIQFAAAYGHLLIEGDTPAGAKRAGDQVVRAIQCGIEVFGSTNVVKQKSILAMILNSEDRFAAYATAAHNEEGLVFPRFQGEPCLQN